MWYMLEASQQQAEAQAKQHASSSGDKDKDKDKDKDGHKDKDKDKEKDGDEVHEKDKSHTAPVPVPAPAPPSMRFTAGRSNTCLLSEQQFPSRWHGLHDLWLVHVPSYLQDRLGYMRYLLRWAGLLDAQAYAAAVAHVKAHCRLEVDVLAVAEAIEAARMGGKGVSGVGGGGSSKGGGGSGGSASTSQGQGQGQGTSNSPATTQNPATSTTTTPTTAAVTAIVTLSSAELAQLERQYPAAKRPGEDFRWYQTHCRGCGSDPRPAPPEQRPVDLYDGMLLNFPPLREIWLFTNGQRRYGTGTTLLL